MLDKEFKLQVIECLYDDVGWAPYKTDLNQEVKEIIKEARCEFPTNRIRVRTYVPEKKV